MRLSWLSGLVAVTLIAGCGACTSGAVATAATRGSDPNLVQLWNLLVSGERQAGENPEVVQVLRRAAETPSVRLVRDHLESLGRRRLERMEILYVVRVGAGFSERTGQFIPSSIEPAVADQRFPPVMKAAVLCVYESSEGLGYATNLRRDSSMFAMLHVMQGMQGGVELAPQAKDAPPGGGGADGAYERLAARFRKAAAVPQPGRRWYPALPSSDLTTVCRVLKAEGGRVWMATAVNPAEYSEAYVDGWEMEAVWGALSSRVLGGSGQR